MKKKKTARIAVIVTLLLVPSVYVLLFLGAYWDPASHMSDIPVAVVNSDKGFATGGVSVNIGSTLVDTLTADSRVHWVQTGQGGCVQWCDDAEILRRADYPRRIFSVNISSAGSDVKTQGRLTFIATDKKGMLASSMLVRALREYRHGH